MRIAVATIRGRKFKAFASKRLLAVSVPFRGRRHLFTLWLTGWPDHISFEEEA